jgi:hypothetical protein
MPNEPSSRLTHLPPAMTRAGRRKRGAARRSARSPEQLRGVVSRRANRPQVESAGAARRSRAGEDSPGVHTNPRASAPDGAKAFPRKGDARRPLVPMVLLTDLSPHSQTAPIRRRGRSTRTQRRTSRWTASSMEIQRIVDIADKPFARRAHCIQGAPRGD